MNILYATDENYVPILSVSLVSLLKTQTRTQDILIVILENGLSEKSYRLLYDIAGQYGAELRFKGITQSPLTRIDCRHMDRNSLMQFGKLFPATCFTEDCKRVLYLDCDTLILQDLSELYEMDLEDKVVGGIEDSFSKWHRKAIGIPETDFYINDGVMIIDLNKWRAFSTEQKIIRTVKHSNGRFLQGDQGIINLVLAKKKKKLPLKYNVVSYNYDFSYKEALFYRRPKTYYSERTVVESKESPAIIHFTSSFVSLRPWETSVSNHPYYHVWREIHKDNGFDIEPRGKSYLVSISNGFLRKPVLCVAMIVHSFIKPIYWWTICKLERLR